MTGCPDIAIIMANYNCARFIGAAIQSLIKQTLTSWELIIVDDASGDNSIAIAEKAAADDPRIRILRQTTNRGPGAARNRALEVVTAPWIAIMDSDDLMPPQRLRTLLRRVYQTGASIVADNLVEFSTESEPRSFFPSRMRKEMAWVTLADFIESNCLYSRTPPLGYVKPLIWADAARGIWYDESLRIAEDYYFLAQVMLRGHNLLLDPSSVYFYRKHQDSTSHRLRTSDIAAMIAADDRFIRWTRRLDPDVERALWVRRRSLDSLMVFDRVVGSLKSRDFGTAFYCVCSRPHAWPLLMQPVRGKLQKLRRVRNRPPRSDEEMCSARIEEGQWYF